MMITKKTLLGMIAFSAVMMADLSRSNAGVVTDSTTGLEWQDDYSDNNGSIKSAAWQGAIDYCEALVLDEHGDWRLPNVRELISIVSLDHVNPAVDPIFQHTASVYWSSTTSKSYGPGYAYYLDFNSGDLNDYDKDNTKYVRCVRSGQ